MAARVVRRRGSHQEGRAAALEPGVVAEVEAAVGTGGVVVEGSREVAGTVGWVEAGPADAAAEAVRGMAVLVVQMDVAVAVLVAQSEDRVDGLAASWD